MELLAVVTPPPIYHGYSTRKTFWEEKITGKENLFLAVDMKNCGRLNVRKHKNIRGGDKYVTLKKHKDIRPITIALNLIVLSGDKLFRESSMRGFSWAFVMRSCLMTPMTAGSKSCLTDNLRIILIM